MMREATKAGVAGLVLLAGIALPQPLGLVCGVVACVLGAIAGWRGSRWWWLLPGVVVVATVGLLSWLTESGAYR